MVHWKGHSHPSPVKAFLFGLFHLSRVHWISILSDGHCGLDSTGRLQSKGALQAYFPYHIKNILVRFQARVHQALLGAFPTGFQLQIGKGFFLPFLTGTDRHGRLQSFTEHNSLHLLRFSDKF
jgi:hypothetical protein